MPIKALPLVPPVKARALPMLLPFGLTTFAVPLEADGCSGSRSRVLLTALPASPFTAAACAREGTLAGASSRATSLVPGRDKNALYGPAYSSHDFDNP